MKHLFIHSVWLVLAGLVLLAPSKANAIIGPEITTTIYQDIDQDNEREGFQIKYEWTVQNISPPANNWNDDAIWEFSIVANLVKRGMYNLQNKDDSKGWDFYSGDQNYFIVNAGGSPVYPGGSMNFTALINRDLVIGNDSTVSTAAANTGTFSSNIIIPITRSQISTNGTTYGWLYDQGLVSNVNLSASYETAALADDDYDGFSNDEEFIAGTEPKQSNSFFRVEISSSALSWNSVTGRVYDVRHTESLLEAFTNAATVEFPTSSVPAAPGFYRVGVKLK